MSHLQEALQKVILRWFFAGKLEDHRDVVDMWTEKFF